MDPFSTRYPLRFSENGTFRVLMMSDIQESAAYDPRSLQSVNALLDQAQPDLVIWGGDNCYGPEIHDLDDLKAFLDIFTKPMEERHIPWAHIFGNHDHDVPAGLDAQQALYESYPMCVSKHTDDTVHGKSNFVLPIRSRNDERIVFNVWGLDTNNLADEELSSLLPEGTMCAAAKLPNNLLQVGRWSIVYFDQLLWYWNTSLQFEQACGAKIPGLLCMHIAPHEFLMADANPELCVKNGHHDEHLDAGAFNSGLFSTILQRGDIRTISCAHTHKNDFEAEYCGIRLCWDACTGYRCYGIDELRGGRVFEIREDDPWHISTKMIHTQALIEQR